MTILVTEYTWLFLVLMGRLRIFLMRHSSTINFTSPFCSALSIDTDRRLWPRRPYMLVCICSSSFPLFSCTQYRGCLPSCQTKQSRQKRVEFHGKMVKTTTTRHVFTFRGAKRSVSDRECKYFPTGMNAR